MSRIQLSSSYTLIQKVLFPAVWLGGFASGTILMIVTKDGPVWIFAVVTLVGALLLIPWAVKLKWVEADESYLYVSGLWDETAVPLAQIESVQQKLWMSSRPVFVVFSEETRFGKHVMFVPPWSLRFWSESPEVNELRKRAGFSGPWRGRDK